MARARTRRTPWVSWSPRGPSPRRCLFPSSPRQCRPAVLSRTTRRGTANQMPGAPRALIMSATEITSSPDSQSGGTGPTGVSDLLNCVRDTSWLLTATPAHLRCMEPYRRFHTGRACSEGRGGGVLEPAFPERPTSRGRVNSGPMWRVAVEASDTLGLVGTHLHKLLPQELGWISSPRLPVAYLLATCTVSPVGSDF